VGKAILFVDDETKVLRSFRRAFLDSDYRVLLAESGREGLEILGTEAIDLVISDMNMPQMNGYEFLQEVKERHPSVIRIILSGYTERNTVCKALIDGSAKAYIAKPWDNQQLKEYIRHMFEVQDILNGKGLLEFINGMGELPTLPSIYYTIISLIQSDADVSEIAEVIEEDPALSARVLKVANSAFYHRATGSIKQAIVYMGLLTIRDIVLSTSVFESLGSTSETHFTAELLWRQSNLCNSIASSIYRLVHSTNVPEEFFASGLLHDIGLLVMLKYFPDKFSQVLQAVEEDPQLSLIDAEEIVVGTTHSELGGYLLNWWNLPHTLIEAALFHHCPLDERSINKEFNVIVHLADAYSWKLLGQFPGIRVIPEVYDLISVPEEAILQEVERVKDRFIP